MTHEDLINNLIGTYRELNFLVRPLTNEQLDASTGGPSVRQILKRAEEQELNFTQTLKETLTGQTISNGLDDTSPIVGGETERDPARVILSQFGTARESALSLLREMDDAGWNTQAGGKTVAERVQAVVENDQKLLANVKSAIGANATPTPA